MKILKASLALVLVSSSLAGCGMDDDGDVADDFRNGVPRRETVELVIPGAGTGQALTDGAEAPVALSVRGQTAELYSLTRAVSGIVNGGGALTLALVKAIILHPPTVVTADSATWGPWTGALEPVTWKLTVNRVGPQKYSYELGGRARTDTTGAFVTVLSGTHSPAVNAKGRPLERFGEGTLRLDWNARATLPMPDDNVGTADYRYARQSPGAGVEVDAEFKGVKDRERPGQLVDVSYRYRSSFGAGGSMEFVHTGPATSAKPGTRLAVKSRWTSSGTGRSDARGTGGDLPAGVAATWNECWNGAFDSVYQAMSWDPSKSYGTEATDCAFTAAEYSNL